MPRHKNNGLRKFCGCLRREWARCGDPWHFSFRGRRVSLNKHFQKPPGYKMSKTEAEALRDELRAQIRDGKFGAPPPEGTAPAAAPVTLGDVADLYLKKHVNIPSRRPHSVKSAEYYVAILKRARVPAPGGGAIALGERPIAMVTKADVEAAREWRREGLRDPTRRGGPGVKGGEIGVERLLRTLRQVFNWAIAEGHADATPFKRHGVTVIRVKSCVGGSRTRRLDPETNEEERLLAAACPPGRTDQMKGHLRDLIVAALETGCRRGELLSLQWHQVKGDMRFLDLPAEKTKTNAPRQIPITARLRAILEYRGLGPDGEQHGPDAHVFGDEAGGRVGRITTAWNATCRRAGIKGLHFHDLRHEFISRLLEAGVAIHKVRDWAGHKNIATTGIYANTTLSHLEDARRAFEARGPRAVGDEAGHAGDAQRWR